MKPTVLIALTACLALAVGCTQHQRRLRQLNAEAHRAYRVGDFARAAERFREALKLDFESAENHYYLAESLRRLGHKDEAIYHYRLALRFMPSHTAARVALADVLAQVGRQDEAIRLMRDYAEAAGAVAYNYLLLGRCCRANGRMREAQAAYEKAVGLEPANALVLAEAGRFYRDIGRKRQAVQLLQRSYELDPTQPGVVKDLRDLGVELGREKGR